MTKPSARTSRSAFQLGGTSVPPGERRTVRLSVPRQLAGDSLFVPVHVLHGRQHGPCLFVSSTIHGDEINGVEIIRRLLERRGLSDLRGTLLAIPVVNVHGFMNHTRYLPDGRDLNRSFPGLVRGSMTSRVAHLFSEEIIGRSTHGIDLHTGSGHRCNLPQIRGDLDDPEVLRLAHAFRVPVILHVGRAEGTLMEATRPRGIPLLVFEGGEALRFDEPAIRAGVRGIMNVLRELGMLPPRQAKSGGGQPMQPLVARTRTWIRAPESGVVLTDAGLGDTVRVGQVLARIRDPFTGTTEDVVATADGVIIGMLMRPLVNEGDAVFHVAISKALDQATEAIDRFGESLGGEQVSYDDSQALGQEGGA